MCQSSIARAKISIRAMGVERVVGRCPIISLHPTIHLARPGPGVVATFVWAARRGVFKGKHQSDDG